MAGDEIASLVISQYHKLPKKGKPLVRSNGVREWTVLAGVVIANTTTSKLECVALATGVKALPDSNVRQSNGKLLHDCHAEILALRAFNSYCITEGIAHIGAIYLYICAPPCGDSSMSLVSSGGGDEWTREPKPVSGELIRGRAHFNFLGHIRTKPGRADSNVTMSKSCSDKLCLRQSRGVLLCPLRHLYQQTLFLDAIVCPGVVDQDFNRAFSRWNPQHRFEYVETSIPFEDFHPSEGAPSPCSLIWTPHFTEVIANGIIQGSKGRESRVTRSSLATAAKLKNPARFAHVMKYRDLKTANQWPEGWIRTASDDGFVV